MDTSSSSEILNRRALLTGAGAAALGAAFLSGNAAAQNPHAASTGSHPHGALIASTGHCVAMGDICLDHCIASLGTGDTMMKVCAEVVIDTIAVCTALGKLASNKSAHLPALAAVAAKVCQTCADECERHSTHSDECKACFDACVACIKECEAAAG